MAERHERYERYDVAAERHHRVAELLVALNETDDAAYHYGLVGENALKHALRASGAERAWEEEGVEQKKNPMKKHMPDSAALITALFEGNASYATGRYGEKIWSVLAHPDFNDILNGWMLDIRYADARCTPVDSGDCRRWAQDADFLLRELVLMI